MTLPRATMWLVVAAIFSSCTSGPASPLRPGLGGYELASFPAVGEPLALHLVDAGDAPRQMLRYELRPGSRHGVRMTMRMSMRVVIGGEPIEGILIPTPVTEIAIEVDDPAGDEHRYHWSIPRPPVLTGIEPLPPELRAAYEAELAGFAGVEGEAVLSRTGRLRASLVRVGGAPNPGLDQTLHSIAQGLEQATVPLPEEPVGVGAVWETLQRMEINATQIYQVARYRVDSLADPMDDSVDGREIELIVTKQELGPPQAVALPEQLGTSARLLELSSRHEGRSTLSLAAPLPASTLAIDLRTVVEASAGGENREMVTDLHREIDIELEAQPGG